MSNQVALEVGHVPHIGQSILVRFLGASRGILTHYVRTGKHKGTIPCPGPNTCDHHSESAKWKGYAPAEVFDQLRSMWRPVAFELTQCAVELVGLDDLRGQCWRFFRVKEKWGDKQVSGEHVCQYNTGDLQRIFCIEATVAKMYHWRPILWDVSPGQFMRQKAYVSHDPPPVIAAPPRPEKVVVADDPRFQAARERMKKPVLNGTKK